MTPLYTLLTASKAFAYSFSGISGWEISQHNIISLLWWVSNFSTYHSTLKNDSPSYSSNRFKNIYWFIFRLFRAGNTSASLYSTIERGRQISPPIFRPEIMTPSIYFSAALKSITDWFSGLSGLEISQIWQLKWVEFRPLYFDPKLWPSLVFFF